MTEDRKPGRVRCKSVSQQGLRCALAAGHRRAHNAMIESGATFAAALDEYDGLMISDCQGGIPAGIQPDPVREARQQLVNLERAAFMRGFEAGISQEQEAFKNDMLSMMDSAGSIEINGFCLAVIARSAARAAIRKATS